MEIETKNNKQIIFSTNVKRNIISSRVVCAIGFAIFIAYTLYKIFTKGLESYFSRLFFNKKTIDMYEPMKIVFFAVIFGAFALSIIFYTISCCIEEEKSKIKFIVNSLKSTNKGSTTDFNEDNGISSTDTTISFSKIKKYNTKKNNFLYLSSFFLLIVFLILAIEKISYISIRKIPDFIAKTDVIIETILVIIMLFLAIFFCLYQLKKRNEYLKQSPSNYTLAIGVSIGGIMMIASIILFTIAKDEEKLTDVAIELMFLIGMILMITGLSFLVSSLIIKSIDDPKIYSKAEEIERGILESDILHTNEHEVEVNDNHEESIDLSEESIEDNGTNRTAENNDSEAQKITENSGIDKVKEIIIIEESIEDNGTKRTTENNDSEGQKIIERLGIDKVKKIIINDSDLLKLVSLFIAASVEDKNHDVINKNSNIRNTQNTEKEPLIDNDGKDKSSNIENITESFNTICERIFSESKQQVA